MKSNFKKSIKIAAYKEETASFLKTPLGQLFWYFCCFCVGGAAFLWGSIPLVALVGMVFGIKDVWIAIAVTLLLVSVFIWWSSRK